MSISKIIFSFTIMLAFGLIQHTVKSHVPEPVVFSELARLEVNGVLVTADWSPGGDKLVIGGENGLYVYTKDFELIQHLQITENQPFVIDAAWNSDGQILASIHIDGRAYLWEIENGEVVAEWKPHTTMPTHISWYYGGSHISTSSWDGTVKIYDATSLQQTNVLVDNELGPIDAISWFPQNQNLTFKTLVGPEIVVWDDLTDQAIFDRASNNSDRLPSANPNKSLMATGGIVYPDGDFPIQAMVHIWETEPTIRPIKTIPLETYDVIDFYVFSWQPNGNLLAAYNSDQQIRIWDIDTGFLIAQLPGGKRIRPDEIPSYSSLAWRCDGQQLIDVGSDGVAVVWEIESPEVEQTGCQ
ncbi:MAG: hypothetical protein CL610_29835 [Anaerolineaceae bacterium]|nr:hypothetical protein [Anaerolineaceae bacterium]